MFWVYFLYSKKKRNVYVGFTSNLKKRVSEHFNGLVKSTKNRKPLVLIYKEKYYNISLVRRREDYLKSLYGSRERKKIIKECFKKYKLGPYTQTF